MAKPDLSTQLETSMLLETTRALQLLTNFADTPLAGFQAFGARVNRVMAKHEVMPMRRGRAQHQFGTG